MQECCSKSSFETSDRQSHHVQIWSQFDPCRDFPQRAAGGKGFASNKYINCEFCFQCLTKFVQRCKRASQGRAGGQVFASRVRCKASRALFVCGCDSVRVYDSASACVVVYLFHRVQHADSEVGCLDRCVYR